MEYEPEPESRAITEEERREEDAAEEAAYKRLDELGDVPGDHEASQWLILLRDLDDPDLGSGTVDMEDAQEVDGMGWIEDTHGGAVFVPHCLADLNEDEDEL